MGIPRFLGFLGRDDVVGSAAGGQWRPAARGLWTARQPRGRAAWYLRGMQDVELYSKVLGTTEPWQVTDVKLDLKGREVVVMVGYDESQ